MEENDLEDMQNAGEPFADHTGAQFDGLENDVVLEWSEQALALWAKSGDDSGWLTLPQHLVDTAGVAVCLWDEWVPQNIKFQLEDDTGLSEHELADFVAWLAGTHDIGKASIPFAAMLNAVPDHQHLGIRICEAGLKLPPEVPKVDHYRHWIASQVILSRWLKDQYQCRGGIARSIASVAGSHHGLPSFPDQILLAEKSINGAHHGEEWIRVQNEIINNITELTNADAALKAVIKSGRELSSSTMMLLCGIVVMADWVASNSDFFPMRPGVSIEWKRIADGMNAFSLPGSWNPPDCEDLSADEAYRHSFGWPEDSHVFPMQEAVYQVAHQCESPSVICIEAPMGNGKTEGALQTAEILAHKFGCGGVMFGAPTMSTSDQLFNRAAKWATTVAGGDIVSMYLGHSKNTLNEDFARMSVTNVYEEDGDNKTGQAIVHDWLWGRKKGMLSTFVVGTVDQILFMALQSKHIMLRHLGLVGKVVIIDEIHAYDAYMSSYLEVALEWLGAYRVPVILLSATLPHSIKAQLMAAYIGGATGEDPRDVIDEVPVSGNAYPAITVGGEHKTELVPVESNVPDADVEVGFIDDDEDALRQVLEPVVEKGGCVLILCNTVTRAQDVFGLAKELVGKDAKLLHARFAANERVKKERELTFELGKNSHRGEGRPFRRIVVATQVVEQSLDVDFDMIITDIAPVDLVLQRIGRLHRHNRPQNDRPEWAQKPRTYIRGINTSGNETQPPEFAPGIESIYPRALLLATVVELGILNNTGNLALPSEIPSLVQRVYADEVSIPHGWAQDYQESVKELQNKRNHAEKKAGTFQLPDPVMERPFSDLWKEQTADVGKNGVSEVRGFAQVRDTDPTLEVVLCQEVPGGYRPLEWIGEGYKDTVLSIGQVPEGAVARDLATSTVRLPYRFSWPKVFDAALDQLEANTDPAWNESRYLRGQLQLLLDEDLKTSLVGCQMHYDRELGLVDEQKDSIREEKE